ncbi:MAG TPA: site-specific integrase [Planctomycetota bacterium]|nr:site-specific integrase [Planctomycetota bacterium]
MNHWEGNPYRRPNSPYWHIVFEDASGVVRRRSTKTKELRYARDALAEQLREVEKQRTGHVDRYAASRVMPLEELVVAYREHLQAQACAFRYVQATVRQVRDFIAFAKASTLPTIAVADAERFVAEIRSKRSAKTRDGYAGALRGFGGWLRRTGRWDVDPFSGLSTRTATKDKHRIYKRVSFRFEEAQQLVEGAWARFQAEKARGGTPAHRNHGDVVRDRQVLYWYALTTAFRANECASINWEDLTLEGPKPGVRLAGIFTKNGDDANIPLQPFVAEALRDMRKRRSAIQVRDGKGPVLQTDRVFHVPDMVAKLVRKDAEYAGLIPQRGPTSKRVDFHCLRKSCARILIELGVHPKTIQQVLRHSDIRLTMDLYGELGEDDLFRDMGTKFPVPRMFAGTGDGAAKSSTPTLETA